LAEQSQDLCFMADMEPAEFIKKHLKSKPGKIIDMVGRVIGAHQGLAFYTIGRRVSIGGPGPFFVVAKNKKSNKLVVSNDEKNLYSRELVAADVSWLSGRAPKLPMKVRVKIRYRSESAPAVIASPALREGRGEAIPSITAVHGIASSPLPRQGGVGTPRNDAVYVSFKSPQRAVTPGQSAVFYGQRNELLGGGVIV
jgi:tRNA-specific 2-thiouridylase